MAATDLVEKIYRVAKYHFARKGYEGTSIRDVAKELGIKNALVQYYTGTKEKLFWEILHQMHEKEYLYFSQIIETASKEEDLSNTTGFRNFLKRLTESYIQSVVEDPDSLRLWAYRYLEETGQFMPLDHQFAQPLYQLIYQQIERGRAAGILQDSEAFVKLYLTSLAWLKHGYFFSHRKSGKDAFDAYDPQNLEMFTEFYKKYVETILDCYLIEK